MIQTIDGGYAIAGNTRSESYGPSDFWLVKVANEDTRADNSLLTTYIVLATAIASVATVATIVYVKRFRH